MVKYFFAEKNTSQTKDRLDKHFGDTASSFPVVKNKWRRTLWTPNSARHTRNGWENPRFGVRWLDIQTAQNRESHMHITVR